MDNKTILAVVLSFLVIVGSQFLFPSEPLKPPVPQPTEQNQPVNSAEKKEEAPIEARPKRIPETTTVTEKEIKVETDLYSAVFSTRGGTLKSWKVKPYKDNKGNDVVLLDKPGAVPAVSIGSNSSFDFGNLTFSVSGRDLKLDSNNQTGTIIFEYAKEGISVRRTYNFSAGTYKIELTDDTSGFPEYWITLGSDFGIFEKDPSIFFGTTVLTGSDIKEIGIADLKEPQSFKENLKWIAQQDKYFFSALVPISPVEEARAFMLQGSPVVAFKAKSGSNKFHLFAGPKEHDKLEAMNLGLEHVVDFGFFSIVARPLFWVLKLFYKFIGNYGWAIVLLTIVTRIPFIPLMNKSQKSMKKLQELQPKMNEVREKFKNDPKRMQAEMMDLYKKNKVSPMGGCLPMLLQIPVFIALYKVLLVAIELRGAPFISYMTDLSAPDSLFGHIPAALPVIGGYAVGPLPLLMGATMFIQQKMTPSTMDPQQAKIMMFLPLIFTFMFLNLASGLVLYWTIGNILSIIQQFYVNKNLAKQKV